MQTTVKTDIHCRGSYAVVVLLTEFTLASLIPIRSKNLCSIRNQVAKLFVRRMFLTSACKA
jgi:hypothetical protein